MQSRSLSSSAPMVMRMLCLFLATSCGEKTQSADVLENYTRVPYEGEYIDNDQFYSPPPNYQTATDDIDLDP